MHNIDLQIIESIRNGDKNVFEQLFKDNFHSLLIYAKSIVVDNEIAKDIIQDVFLKIWEKRNS